MGDFIGGIGAAFILAAAAAVITKFLMEINLIKDAEKVKSCAKVTLCTLLVGSVYVTITALMYNEFKGQTNYFNLEKIFNFMGIKDTLSVCKDLNAADLFSGMRMPLYPIIVHTLGGAVFEQYTLTAQFISSVSACVASCFLYTLIRSKSDKATELMLLLASLPYAFCLFAPTYIALMTAFAAAALYAIKKNKKTAYIILSVLALLTGKAGLALFALYPLVKYTDSLLAFIESKLIKNAVVFRVIITLFILFNSAVLCALTRGI